MQNNKCKNLRLFCVFGTAPFLKGEKMRILFEDEELVVCVKPVGTLSQGEGGSSLITMLGEQTKSEIFPVHRLDREAGGVMVYAKTRAAAASLSRQAAERKLQKEYFALVHGVPQEASAVLEDLLFKDSKRNKVFVVKRERKGVKKAVCEYETLLSGHDREEACSLVKVTLHTGRTHQIRVQFSSRGLPLFGDRKYGAKDSEKVMALFSCRIGFTHPKTGERLSFYFDRTESEPLNRALEAAKSCGRI